MGACGTGLVDCGGACVDTQTSAAHCGACDNACPPDTTCAAGLCGAGCPGDLTTCGDACVDVQSDAAHCGACDVACGPGVMCVAGQCGACTPGQTQCGASCVDVQTDSQHCGSCGNACGPGFTCVAGLCQSACPPGEMDCGGLCVNTQTSPSHCGSCGNACAGPQTCQGGVCVCPGGGMCGLCGIQSIGSMVPQTQTGTTLGAPDVYAPSCGGSGSGEVVYAFTAPAAGVYNFDTVGASYDTVLAVVSQACGELACNDDAPNTLESRVQVTLAAGQTVVVVVDGASGEEGSFTLNVSELVPPPCPIATLPGVVPQTVTGNTTGNVNYLEPSCGAPGGPEHTYSFTAPASGSYTFDTFGSTFDTVLHAHDATCLGPELDCNDDTGGLQSQVTVTLSAGQTIVVVVDGHGGGSGPFTLSVTQGGMGSMCDNMGFCGDSTSGCLACALNGGCAGLLQACQASLNCVNYVNCIDPCLNQACLDACGMQYPTGKTEYDALVDCVICGECPGTCAMPGMCP